MAKTVAAAFEEFRQKIEPPPYSRQTATARKDRLVSVLSRRFEIIDAFPSGSIPRFTAVREHSDLDIIVALNWERHIKGRVPLAVLQAVRAPLADYQPLVRRDGQALTIDYGTWPKVDIVPAHVVGGLLGLSKLYYIPDGIRGAWIPTNPPAHDLEMQNANADGACGPAFKRVVKMMKWWNVRHGHVLSSFHIEVIALTLFAGKKMSEALYPVHMQAFLKGARDLLVAGTLMHNGRAVDSYLTTAQRQLLIKRLDLAQKRALSACLFGLWTQRKNDARAIALWKRIFNSLSFPAYR